MADTSMGQCVQCQGEMVVRPPSINFVNMPEVSLIVMGHGRPDTCPNCGAMFVPTFQGFKENGQLNIVWKQVDPQHSPIMAPTPAQTAAISRAKGSGLVTEG